MTVAQRAGGLRLRPPRNLVDRRAITMWATRSAIGFAVAALALGVLAVLVEGAAVLFAALAALTVVAGAAYAVVVPRWRYRVHRWEVTDDAVYTRSGWLWEQWRLAPMSRIQTVDTMRGPLYQLFKLSAVTVTTASAVGPIRIDGLDDEFARELVDRLNHATQAAPGDAT
ncbi:PH domain-containing protein [Nonomuraea sp. NPDC000554]|uniref:PH domain-containing protein n=1 Tax=Nonomuraea sp. NPDC000554 TaxID=3154259 RepID=UPI003329411E